MPTQSSLKGVTFRDESGYRLIRINSGITDEVVYEVVDLLVDAKEVCQYQKAVMEISSPGGSDPSLNYLLERMNLICSDENFKIETQALTLCASAAAVILSMGNRSYASPAGQLHYHHGRLLAKDNWPITARNAELIRGQLEKADNNIIEQIWRSRKRVLCEKTRGKLKGCIPLPIKKDEKGKSKKVGWESKPILKELCEKLLTMVDGKKELGDKEDKIVTQEDVNQILKGDEVKIIGREKVWYTSLWKSLFELDKPIEPELAEMFGLIDKVGFHFMQSHDEIDAAQIDSYFKIPHWKSLGADRIPEDEPLRHYFFVGETGSGKSASGIFPLTKALFQGPSSWDTDNSLKEGRPASNFNLQPNFLIIDPKKEIVSKLLKDKKICELLKNERPEDRINLNEAFDSNCIINVEEMGAERSDGPRRHLLDEADRIIQRVAQLEPGSRLGAYLGVASSNSANEDWDRKATLQIKNAIGFVLWLINYPYSALSALGQESIKLSNSDREKVRRFEAILDKLLRKRLINGNGLKQYLEDAFMKKTGLESHLKAHLNLCLELEKDRESKEKAINDKERRAAEARECETEELIKEYEHDIVTVLRSTINEGTLNLRTLLEDCRDEWFDWNDKMEQAKEKDNYLQPNLWEGEDEIDEKQLLVDVMAALVGGEFSDDEVELILKATQVPLTIEKWHENKKFYISSSVGLTYDEAISLEDSKIVSFKSEFWKKFSFQPDIQHAFDLNPSRIEENSKEITEKLCEWIKSEKGCEIIIEYEESRKKRQFVVRKEQIQSNRRLEELNKVVKKILKELIKNIDIRNNLRTLRLPQLSLQEDFKDLVMKIVDDSRNRKMTKNILAHALDLLTTEIDDSRKEYKKFSGWVDVLTKAFEDPLSRPCRKDIKRMHSFFEGNLNELEEYEDPTKGGRTNAVRIEIDRAREMLDFFTGSQISELIFFSDEKYEGKRDIRDFFKDSSKAQKPRQILYYSPKLAGPSAKIDQAISRALKAVFFEQILTSERLPQQENAGKEPSNGYDDGAHSGIGETTEKDIRRWIYVADEFQTYITSTKEHGEQFFVDRCRAYGVCCIFATQSRKSLEYALMEQGEGTEKARAAVDILLANMGTKIFFRSTDPVTIDSFSDLVPEMRKRDRLPHLKKGECWIFRVDGSTCKGRVKLNPKSDD